MNIFLSAKNLLLEHIQLLDKNRKEFVRDPLRDFTRNRKLSFSDLILLIISMECGSIRSELLKYFSYSPDTATSSAFIQQRDKIRPEAFRSLFRSFSSMLPSKGQDGYRLYAVDGSAVLIPLPGEDEAYSYSRREGQRPYHQIHLSAVYDLVSNQYADAYIEPRKGHDERAAFHRMLEEGHFPQRSVFLFDRGYEGYPLMAHISRERQFFVIRAKDGHTGGILKGIDLPQEEEFDFLFDRIMVGRMTAKHRQAPDLYHRVHPSDTPYFLNGSVKEYRLAFRIVRLRLDNGTYECLLTNLPKERFGMDALRRLYGMRWGIETSFRHLKYSIGLLYFHSKKIEAIEQEIWARLILYNYCMAVTMEAGRRETRSQYRHRPNIANAIHVCRRLLKMPTDEIPPDIGRLISGELLPIRPERSSPRIRTPLYPRKFNYRVL